MKIVAARLLLRLLSFVPLPVQFRVSGLLAGLIRRLPWRKNEIVDRNLECAFPEWDTRQRRALAVDNTAAILSTAFEAGALWHRSRSWIERRIQAVEGRGRVDDALAAGRGLLVLGGHLGQWELSILYGSLTLPIDYLYKPPKSATLDLTLTRHRSRFGGRMIPTGGPAMRRAVRQLRAGRALGMLFDQLPKGGEFVQAPFFGRPVATMTLPHRLISATGCAVVMGHCVRLPGGRGWKVVFDPVPGADDPDPARSMAAMNLALERAVRRTPEQYLWQYRRFDPMSPIAS